MKLFETLGFKWDRKVVPDKIELHSVERCTFRFQQMLPEFVWDASVLEGNPFTYPEVKTLLDGITVGGRRISDQEQILNLVEASSRLLTLVRTNNFKLDKETYCSIHTLVARNEALEWGHFRGEGFETNYTPSVSLGDQGSFKPLPTIKGAPELNKVFEDNIKALEELPPFEKGCALFLSGALEQYFFDGNKRTARFMMNGALMTAGIDAISIPAAQVQAFNEKMVRFYVSKDATEMFEFLIDCHQEIHKTNDQTVIRTLREYRDTHPPLTQSEPIKTTDPDLNL